MRSPEPEESRERERSGAPPFRSKPGHDRELVHSIEVRRLRNGGVIEPELLDPESEPEGPVLDVSGVIVEVAHTAEEEIHDAQLHAAGEEDLVPGPEAQVLRNAAGHAVLGTRG